MSVRLHTLGRVFDSVPAGQVVAIKHARRSKDETKYPVLEQFNHVYNSHGDAEAYLEAEPTEALCYILDDFALAMNIMDKTADGLALLVSALCQAAVQEVAGAFPASCIGLESLVMLDNTDMTFSTQLLCT